MISEGEVRKNFLLGEGSLRQGRSGVNVSWKRPGTARRLYRRTASVSGGHFVVCDKNEVRRWNSRPLLTLKIAKPNRNSSGPPTRDEIGKILLIIKK